MPTNNTIISFESNLFEGVNTFVRYIVNEFIRKQWMTDSIEQKRKYVREAINKLVQLQICKMKDIYMNIRVNLVNNIMMSSIAI